MFDSPLSCRYDRGEMVIESRYPSRRGNSCSAGFEVPNTGAGETNLKTNFVARLQPSAWNVKEGDWLASEFAECGEGEVVSSLYVCRWQVSQLPVLVQYDQIQFEVPKASQIPRGSRRVISNERTNPCGRHDTASDDSPTGKTVPRTRVVVPQGLMRVSCGSSSTILRKWRPEHNLKM